MSFLGFLESKSTTKIRRSNVKLSDFLDYMQQKGWYNINATLAMQMYEKNSALADAVDTITDAAKTMPPVIKRDNKELIYNSEIIKLLENPNPDDTYKDFISPVIKYFLLTGNSFITVIGNSKFLPNEIYFTPTTSVSAQGEGKDYSLNVYSPNALRFLDASYKYDSQTGRLIGNDYKEMIHIKRFINYTTTDGYIAGSILSSILFELEVLNNGNNHNLALLLNGVNLSGVFNLDTGDKEAVEQFKLDIQNYFGGSGNAGKYLVSEGKTVTFSPIQMTNKDMQQDTNLDMCRKVIYDRLNIPGPLRNDTAQTYDNYATAQYVLYDRAVFPVLDDFYQTLTLFFRKRKVLKNNEVLTYDTTGTDALKQRLNDDIRRKKETGVFTPNELREMQGYNSYGVEGDSIYINNNMVPLGETTFYEEAQKNFIKILKKNGYSDKEIVEKVKKHYGDSNQ